MPKHIARLLILIAVILVLGIAARNYFVTDSFYLYGHYRGDAVAELASDVPKYRGPAYCQDCHADRHKEWSIGIHNSADIKKVVKCEVCHGPAGDHPANGKLPIPKDTQKLCTLCHEAMPGRPVEQRQIVVATHAGAQQCIVCHNPHSPKINFAAPPQTPLGAAKAGATVATACTGCHGEAGVSDNPQWPNLAGQHAGYLGSTLKAFKSGARADAMMSGVVAGMSDTDMQNVAAYFAAAKCKTTGADKAKAELGKAKAASCAVCHGAAGVSGNPAWPNLAGQNADYLSSSLKAFQSSRNNPVMTGVAKALSVSDIDNLAAYYANASCK